MEREDSDGREVGVGAADFGALDILRPVMKALIADGKVETEGQRRGMTYAAV